MTERASPLPAAHCVRLDCACDGAIITPTFRKAQPNQEHRFLSASSPSQAPRASSPKGGAFSRRQTFRYIQNLSLWERWHRGAMTERASPLTAAHRVRLDSTCDRAAYTCDRENGFIFSHTRSPITAPPRRCIRFAAKPSPGVERCGAHNK